MTETVTALEKMIKEELARFGVPGVGVAVVKEGKTLLCRGFEVRDVERDLPVTDQTLFPIGSTTKAFTATVLGCLVDEGKLEWDVPVRNYLPTFELSDPVATQEVTLRDMLSHRTGLPRHDMLMFMYGGGQLSRAELVKRLPYLQLNKRPREAWQYNNLIYMTAGYLTEVVDGKTWEEAIRERLFAPLRMTNSNLSLNESQKSEDHSKPHAEKDGDVVPVPFRNIEMIGPAGSINSCIADMTQWLRLNLQGGRVNGHQILSEGALNTVHDPAMVLPSAASHWDEMNVVGYALGWVVEDYRGHRLLWHNGGVDGFKAMIAFVPKQNVGVCVLANLFPSEAPEALAYRIFDELLGLEPLPWGERFHELETQMTAAAEEARSHGKSKAKDAGPTHPLDEYAGVYAHPAYGRITFEVADGDLAADLHGLHVTLEHRHYNVWNAHESAHDILIPVVFQMDLEGDISTVEIPLEPSVDPIRFEREPDTELSDPAVLEGLTGSFELGPLAITVERTGSTLKATVPGAGVVELIPLRNYRFSLKGHEGLQLEFVRHVSGVAQEVVFEGAGIFRRTNTE